MMEFPHFVDYYNQVFHDEFMEYFYSSFTSYGEIKKDLSSLIDSGSRLHKKGDSIKVILNLAKK